jgi:hypothetical protein
MFVPLLGSGFFELRFKVFVRLDKDFNVAPPFKSFSMTFPQDTLVNGINLNSALVTIMTRKDFMGLYGTTVITMINTQSKSYFCKGFKYVCPIVRERIF